MIYLPCQVEATASHLVTWVFTRLPMSFLDVCVHGDNLWWMQRVAEAVRFLFCNLEG